MDDLSSLYPHAHFNNFSWPSLYSPGTEVGFKGPPVRPGGYYLSDPDDVFKFTLYWTLIFHLPFSFIAGIYAFFNFLFPPVRDTESAILLVSPVSHPHTPSHSRSQSQSQSHSQSYPPPHSDPQPPVDEWLKLPRMNERRSRLVFSLLVLFTFLVVSLLRAVVGAAILSWMLFGVYRAGGFYMSTWIPFLWAGIQSLIGLLEIWPSVIDII